MKQSKPWIIAVDGPAGSGKSSLCTQACERLGFSYLNTGILYRVVAWWVEQHGLTEASEEALCDALTPVVSQITWDSSRNEILFEGKPISYGLYEESIGALASYIAKLPRLRALLLPLQRNVALQCKARGVVVDGRDIAAVVFPDAEVKIFMEASPEVRARRRWSQLQVGAKPGAMIPNLEEIQAQMEQRDLQDRTRAVSPLQRQSDALLFDTSLLSFDDSVAALVQLIQTHLPC